MMNLLRLLASWSVRRFLLFVLIVAGLVAFVQLKAAWDRVPAAEAEIAALERREAAVAADAEARIARARAALGEIQAMEGPALRRRLQAVRTETDELRRGRLSGAGIALKAATGEGDAIASDIAAGFRIRLLEREEGLIRSRLEMLDGHARATTLAERIRAMDARIATLEREIAQIERRHPLLDRVGVPVVRSLVEPWRELRAKRGELEALRTSRARTLRAQHAAAAAYRSAGRAYQAGAQAIRSAGPPVDALRAEIAEKRGELSRNWSKRAWRAVRPVLGWALWLTLLVILTPPAIKAFWFFLVAPRAERLAPVRLRAEKGEAAWAERRRDGGGAGSGVSWRLALRPSEELLVRPDYLQSSMTGEARIDSRLLLDRSMPLGSFATGLVGLTRIRVDKESKVALSAMADLVDEVGVIEVAEGSALVFRPRNLIGIVQPVDRPMRLERVWRLGHPSAWLTLQLRHLVFHGPCALVVKGARGVAIEPVEGGRRVAGAATMGWSAGLGHSVMRSETFLAYLTGKQSLFNDRFEGGDGVVVYEELPRAGARGGLFGRGLEGIGDAMLKIVGL